MAGRSNNLLTLRLAAPHIALAVACICVLTNIPASASEAALKGHVEKLAMEIGIRSIYNPTKLSASEAYIREQLIAYGYEPQTHQYSVNVPGAGKIEVANISVILPGSSPKAPVLVVGAHYDTAPGTPGADDNASGVATLLELARRLKGTKGGAELHLVAFCTEEPPYFGTVNMGSYRYAKSLKDEKRELMGMIALEMLGFYSDEKNSQSYPPFLSLFFPSKANYIAVISNRKSKKFLKKFKESFKPSGELRVVTAALPGIFQAISFSDHSSFWKHGYKGIMITDTAFLRNPHYHERGDTPETLNYGRMLNVLDGIEKAVIELRQ